MTNYNFSGPNPKFISQIVELLDYKMQHVFMNIARGCMCVCLHILGHMKLHNIYIYICIHTNSYQETDSQTDKERGKQNRKRD